MAQDQDLPTHDNAARGQSEEVAAPQQVNAELAKVSLCMKCASDFMFYVQALTACM